MKNIGDHVYDSSPYPRWRGLRQFNDCRMKDSTTIIHRSVSSHVRIFINISTVNIVRQSLRDSIRTSIKNKL